MSVTLRQRSRELGLRLDDHALSVLGRLTSLLHQARHGEKPPLHPAARPPRYTRLRIYSRRDLDLLDQALDLVRFKRWQRLVKTRIGTAQRPGQIAKPGGLDSYPEPTAEEAVLLATWVGALVLEDWPSFDRARDHLRERSLEPRIARDSQDQADAYVVSYPTPYVQGLRDELDRYGCSARKRADIHRK